MTFEIPVGTEGEQQLIVTYEDTAANYGSGLVEVYATPAMVALMEKTCLTSILPFLPGGYGSVGIGIDITHTKATPVGMQVICRSRVVEVDRRRLVFEVEAEDEAGVIGKGRHERFIINSEEFMAKITSPVE